MGGRVEGKVVIVTGGASGLGAASAELLVQEGAKVAITDINEADGRALAERLGPNALFIAHDVTSPEQWQDAVEQTLKAFGRIDVLVNNAGIVLPGTVEDCTIEDWRRIQNVNADSVFYGVKATLPALKDAGGGSIVNLSSIAALMAVPPYLAYSASKGAVRSMTKSMAVDFKEKGYNIRVNSIHPGGINTPMTHPIIKAASGVDLKEQPDKAYELGLGQPIDIANMVLYLASDESAYVNGAEMVVDNCAIVE